MPLLLWPFPSGQPAPPQPTLPLTGKLFIIDAVQGYYFGPNPLIGECCQMLIYVGPGMTLGSGNILLTFTRPDGTTLVGDPTFAFIGDTRVTQLRIGDFLVGQYIVYSFHPGDLNIKGFWRVSFIAEHFFSNTFTFKVVPP